MTRGIRGINKTEEEKADDLKMLVFYTEELLRLAKAEVPSVNDIANAGSWVLGALEQVVGPVAINIDVINRRHRVALRAFPIDPDPKRS